MKSKINVGIIGCGDIAKKAYFPGLQPYPEIVVSACADLDLARAKKMAEAFEVQKACSPEQLLADPDIDIVLNLTVPKAHASINRKALEHGKHVYVEKPFALSVDEANSILELAKSKNLRVGSAPDTFLGSGYQTARKAIDDGLIGTPISATAFFSSHGPEEWHPNPEFFYLPGGGPALDMGPYYTTVLVSLLGPIKSVSAMASRGMKERTLGSKTRKGEKIPVKTDTHFSANVRFENGAVGSMIYSFDTWAHNLPYVEIHGTKGSLSCPDPNHFPGVVKYRKPEFDDWKTLKTVHADNSRGYGLADMIAAIRNNRPQRADAAMATHVLEVLLSMAESSETKQEIPINSHCKQPNAVPAGLDEAEIGD